jgi:hypothetical protein
MGSTADARRGTVRWVRIGIGVVICASWSRPVQGADRAYNCSMAARDIRVRRTTLAAADEVDDEGSLTPAQRVEIVWQLTRDAWTFKDGRWDEPRLRRDVGRVIRRGR